MALLYEKNFPVDAEEDFAPCEDVENVEYCSPALFPASISLICNEDCGCLEYAGALLDDDANCVGGGKGEIDVLGGDM